MIFSLNMVSLVNHLTNKQMILYGIHDLLVFYYFIETQFSLLPILENVDF